jgi:very-short-patch-repair endonuclease
LTFSENFKLIAELDGAQHFEQVSNWKSPEETSKVDNLKYCALKTDILEQNIWNNNKID